MDFASCHGVFEAGTFKTLIHVGSTLSIVCDMFVICVAYALWQVCTFSKYVICLCLYYLFRYTVLHRYCICTFMDVLHMCTSM